MYSNGYTWLDRLCARHPRLGIPNLMAVIVAGNVLVYLMDLFSQGTFSSMLTFIPGLILQGEVWRLLTFVFVPESSDVIFLVLSCYFYYFVGSTLEREWGTAKFTFFYLLGVLLNILYGIAVGGILGFEYTAQHHLVTASIYYVNLSLFFAFATLWPNMQLLLFFIIPIKIKWLAWFDAALFAWEIIRYLMAGAYIYALLPVVAVANYLVFFAPSLLSMVGMRVRHRTAPGTINFRKAQRQAKKKARETGGYTHKCAVCGITDRDDPNMEFRYCSKCSGYYCYCMNHINNHVHIQDS